MRNAVGCTLAFALFTLCGCGGWGHSAVVMSPNKTVEAALHAIGGREAWEEVDEVSAVAIVTMYDEEGSMHVHREHQDIDLAKGEIVARGVTPLGRWRATATIDGGGTVLGRGCGDAKRRQRLVRALATILHRVAGPLNFVFGPERPRSEAPARIAGEDVIRVGVGGDSRRAIAYYFLPRTRLLRFVTSGGDRAATKGTFTEYTYMRLPNGMAFPQTIRVRRIGEYALRGPEIILQMEYSQVTIH